MNSEAYFLNSERLVSAELFKSNWSSFFKALRVLHSPNFSNIAVALDSKVWNCNFCLPIGQQNGFGKWNAAS